MAKIVMLEGHTGFGAARRGRRGQGTKLGRASKACKGLTKGARKVCMRNYFKKH